MLLYVTGDRPAMETQIGPDVDDIFVEHLDAIWPAEKISLVLYTTGGNTATAWRLINLLRTFCDELEIIVLVKAQLGLWAQADIAHDTGLPKQPGSQTAFTLGHNVMHREDVDQIMATAAHAGAVIVKTAQDTFYGGYAGYFSDPDGHLWEVVWNPELLPTEG